jgi:tRNA nucleotidyltransferase/poly(A) polymerase
MEMSLEKLDEDRVEKALIYLSTTDEDHATLGSEVKRLEEGIKQAKAHSFLLAEGGVSEREQKAIASLRYDEAVCSHIEAYKQFKILDNKRNTEIRITELWQTLSSNRRKGSI